MWLYDHDCSISISVSSYVCPYFQNHQQENSNRNVAQWYEMNGIHTLLVCSASCLHMLLHCLHNFRLDLLILHLHLIHASCNRNKHWVLSLRSTLPITTITVYDSIEKDTLHHAGTILLKYSYSCKKKADYSSSWSVAV